MLIAFEPVLKELAMIAGQFCIYSKIVTTRQFSLKNTVFNKE